MAQGLTLFRGYSHTLSRLYRCMIDWRLAEPEPVKLVVYDFDQTISSDHIYHKLDAS